MPEGQYDERVIAINRVAKVVSGGRRFSFTALVVVGDGAGNVGLGYGKAKEVPAAIQKGMEDAPSATCSRFRSPRPRSPTRSSASTTAARVFLKPAAARYRCHRRSRPAAILEAAGIHDVLAKSLGSATAINVAHATIQGLHATPASRRRREVRGLDARRMFYEGDAHGLPRAENRPKHEVTEVGVMAELKVTLIRSRIGKRKAQTGRNDPRPGPRKDRQHQYVARPARDPGIIARVPHLITVEEIQ